MTDVNFIVAFMSGVLSFLSPCVLPLVPSYLSFISGVSLEDMRAPQVTSQVRWRVISNSLAFIFGFSLIFIAFGASASFLGSLFLGYRKVIRIAGGILIVLVGAYLMGFLKIPLLGRYLQFQLNHLKDKRIGYLGSVLIGLTFAVAWTPCVGPILGSILTLAGTSAEINKGMLLLTIYAAGLAVPFFLSAVALNSFFLFFTGFRRYIHAVHMGAGFLLVIVGILLVTDYMTLLNTYAIRWTPSWLIQRL
jgi:cytochrome c-type biogenesis protein